MDQIFENFKAATAPSMDNVINVEFFIDEDDLAKIQSYISSNKDKFESGGKRNSVDDWKIISNITMDPEILDMLRSYKDKARAKARRSYGFDLENTEYAGVRINQWTVGESMGPHEDNKDFHVAALMYLNDDYEGGEILFFSLPDENGELVKHSIKPRAGSLILFPGYYTHGVKEITSGERYTMSTWFKLSGSEFFIADQMIQNN